MKAVQQQLPLTVKELGPSFSQVFKAYAQQTPLSPAIHFHQQDAIAFLEYCLSQEAEPADEGASQCFWRSSSRRTRVLGYELARHRAVHAGRGLTLFVNIRYFPTPPPSWLPAFIQRPAVILWYRWGPGGRLFHWQWVMPSLGA
jgi:hypothetical protein